MVSNYWSLGSAFLILSSLVTSSKEVPRWIRFLPPLTFFDSKTFNAAFACLEEPFALAFWRTIFLRPLSWALVPLAG